MHSAPLVASRSGLSVRFETVPEAAWGSPPPQASSPPRSRRGSRERLSKTSSPSLPDLFNLEQGSGILSVPHPGLPPPAVAGAGHHRSGRAGRPGRQLVKGPAQAIVKKGEGQDDDASSSSAESEGCVPTQALVPNCSGGGGGRLGMLVAVLVIVLNLLAVGCLVYSFKSTPSSHPRTSSRYHDASSSSEKQPDMYIQRHAEVRASAEVAGDVNQTSLRD